MKKIMVACGTGMATSTMIASKVKEFLDSEGIASDINQCQLSVLKQYDGKYDLFITSMKIEEEFNTPIVLGTTFLIGMNEEKTKKEILEVIG